jgi:uridine kinase
MLIRTKENTFKVRFQSGKESAFIKGTMLTEILEFHEPSDKKHVVLAKVNNIIKDLRHKPQDDCTVEWICIQTSEGIRSYQLTLCWILIKALNELYPSKNLLIDHSLGKGLYCEFKDAITLDAKKVLIIRKRMQQIIRNNESIKPTQILRDKARQILQGENESLDLFMENGNVTSLRFYMVDKIPVFLGYPLFPSTGMIRAFDLRPWKPGMILRFPDMDDILTLPPFIRPKKLFQVFHEFGNWEQILGIEKIHDVNESITNGRISDLIKICEGLHEKRISRIADLIAEEKRNLRLILISGPSSSGKTTFTKRLGIQLQVNGQRPLAVSLDNYFLPRHQTPMDQNGNPDYESPTAIDIDRLNRDLSGLLRGEMVQLPIYDFKTGRQMEGQTNKLENHQPILIEGIHALNDGVTSALPGKIKFKIYVSALTQLNITDYLRIHTSDIRLLRRLIRDNLFRGHSPIYTLENWPSVRQGEENYIFPFQEDAATIFNTALPYELTVLKPFAEPLLSQIPLEHPTFTECHRLLDLLKHAEGISLHEVPANSILREFIGQSSFVY